MIPIEVFDPNAHPVLDENGYWVALTFLRCLNRTRSRCLLHPSLPGGLGEEILRGLLDLAPEEGAPLVRELVPLWLEALEATPCPEHPEFVRAEREIRLLGNLQEADVLVARAIVVFQSQARCGALLSHGAIPDRHQLDRDRILSAVTDIPVPIITLHVDDSFTRGLITKWPPKLLEVAVSPTVWTLYHKAGMTVADLNARHYEPMTGGKLDLNDFAHLKCEIASALGLLRIGTRDRSTNLLRHGPPGHGKTELAVLLARSAGHVAERISEAPAIDLMRRYKSYGQGVLIIDEADAMLRCAKDSDSFKEEKAAINELLELPGRPIIWIVNDLDGIEASFLRRFQMILEPSDPSGEVLHRVLERRFPGDIQMLSDLRLGHGVSPALIEQYADVVSASHPESSIAWKERFTALLDQHEHAHQTAWVLGRGRRRTSRWTQEQTPDFRTDFVGTDDDLATLLEAGMPPGRVLLHGPPGTGKTAFAHALAKAQGIPLLVKAPSDLLSPYVGKTEERLAQAFAEAAQRRALLFLDELDGILHSRERAQRSWEVTKVNELLLQIDRYNGWLVAATNALDRVDPAALRRFDLKLAFLPPTADQREVMVGEWLRTLGNTVESGALVRARQLEGLVPGDLACVSRRLRYVTGQITSARALDLLAEELKLRGPIAGRPFGFASGTIGASQGTH